MKITQIDNNQKAVQTFNDPKETASHREKIILIFAGFLMTWAALEVWGRSVQNFSQEWKEDLNLLNKYCFPSPNLACPCQAINMTINWILSYPMKIAYKNIGSFGITAALYTIPTMIAVNLKPTTV